MLTEIAESSKLGHSHSHNHSHNHGAADPATDPEIRFAHFLAFLESQFGASAVKPILTPNLPALSSKPDPDEDDEDADFREQFELERLAALGIPVPGVEISVDRHVVKVWLETLEVECTTSPVLRDRVKKIVENAVETVAPMWSIGDMQRGKGKGEVLENGNGIGSEADVVIGMEKAKGEVKVGA